MDQKISDNANSTDDQAQQFISNRADATARRRAASRWAFGFGLTVLGCLGYNMDKAAKHEDVVEGMAKMIVIGTVLSTVGGVLGFIKKMGDAYHAHDEAEENDKALVMLTGDINQAEFAATRIELFSEQYFIQDENNKLVFVPRNVQPG